MKGVPLATIRRYNRGDAAVKTSLVRNARSGAYEERAFVLPLVISICSDCGYPAVAVSADAANVAVWEHTTAIHLPNAAMRAMLSGVTPG